VCCAHALIVHMYNAYDWLRSCVFVYMFPTLNVMGHGSHIRWVNGSWVNSNDPLPALLGRKPPAGSRGGALVGRLGPKSPRSRKIIAEYWRKHCLRFNKCQVLDKRCSTMNTCSGALYNLEIGNWLAWANDTASHYAAIHCPRCSMQTYHRPSQLH